ncbi:MAG: glycosyltransferase family 39 protein, partial [Bacteroidia bacterium]|nr:glycosyltransferase family 39 protein [Bacteroidia bacterium]
MIRGGVYADFHPVGVQSFLYCWTNLLGESAFLLRLPFILFGLGSTWLIYRLGSRWFHAAAGLLAAAMFSVLEYSI